MAPAFRREEIEMSEITEKTAQRIAAVREFAKQPANYEAGWSVIVETYDDAQLAELVKGAKSDNGAIAMARKAVTLWKEQQANTAFEAPAEQPADEAKADAPAAKVAPTMPNHKPGCGCVGCRSLAKKAGFEVSPAVAKAAKAKPVKATVNACRCGCGNSTGSTFAPGHDARFASMLKRAYLAGEVTKDDAQGQASAVSLNFSSKVRRMLDLADKEIAKAIQAEAGAVAK
jgi:hypothetical protein